MVGASQRSGSLFYLALAHQASLIKDDLLDTIDALLDDPALVELVRQRLHQRYPLSRITGRPSIAPDRLLRACALKHIKGWSFRMLERELRNGLVYRKFTRFDDDPIPNFSVFSRTFALLGGEISEQIHRRTVLQARVHRVAMGRRLRTDTTVCETNIHHPTDSTLLADGVRVLQRALKRISEECATGTLQVVDHGRSVKRRVLEIYRAAKAFNESNRERLKQSYKKLVAVTGEVLEQAKNVSAQLENGELKVVGSATRVVTESGTLKHFLPLVEQVVRQTRARVFEGERHFADKIVSLFEAHTQVIRKGKVHKRTEFGRLVRIDQAENGIVGSFAVAVGNPADSTQWEAALEGHEETFGRVPEMATADRGFFSAANEQVAHKRGVKRVVLPARGKLSESRRKLQKQRWFRRALRWRAGIEAEIATLKHRFGMVRACYKGEDGFKRAVGWSVIANNLVMIARCKRRPRGKAPRGKSDGHGKKR